RLMDEFYGSRPERSAEGAASPTLREAPFPKDLSPFGPAPDVNPSTSSGQAGLLLRSRFGGCFSMEKMKTCL
ncbi:MAG: hypothetical protein WA821_13910, partial [Anaerolineales bacterium]